MTADRPDRARHTLEAVEASAPVQLEREEVAPLVQIVEIWMRNVRGPERLPEGICEFRNALVDDPHDSAK